VPELIAKTALAGQAPVTHLGTTLAEADPGPITSIAAFPGQMKKLVKALGHFPAPNTHAKDLVWTGPEQAFLLGRPAPDLAGLGAVTDQSGGWACLSLTGPKAAEVLMRLIPLDLRQLGPGQAARAPLGHMSAILMGEEGGFRILVFRSMARTAWHEIEDAMKMLAARAAV
jgi:sarcosine oxidase subunit gamma